MRSDRIVEDVGLVAFDPGADEAVEFLGFEQERIVAEIGGEFGVTGAFAGTEERESELAILLGREEPVAGETDDEGLGLDGSEGLLERAVGVGEIELVEGAGDVEIRVGVEAVDKTLALVAQVALDFELDVEGVGVAVGGVFLRRPNLRSIDASET